MRKSNVFELPRYRHPYVTIAIITRMFQKISLKHFFGLYQISQTILFANNSSIGGILKKWQTLSTNLLITPRMFIPSDILEPSTIFRSLFVELWQMEPNTKIRPHIYNQFDLTHKRKWWKISRWCHNQASQPRSEWIKVHAPFFVRLAFARDLPDRWNYFRT